MIRIVPLWLCGTVGLALATSLLACGTSDSPAGGAAGSGSSSGGTSSTAGTNSTAGAPGAGAGTCSNVVPCGGNVVGTWNVTSSCLKLSGNMDASFVSLGCPSVPVTGTVT